MAVGRRCLDFWTLVASPRAIGAADINRAIDVGIARLLQSRSPRSNAPLKFAHKSATAAIAEVMETASDLPESIRVAVVEDLVRQPPRYVQLLPSAEGLRRVGMSGAYEHSGVVYLVLAEGILSQVGPTLGFVSLDVRAVDVPSEIDLLSAAILAEELERLAADATDAESNFEWGGTRASRALWCGVPPEVASGRRLVAVGLVAGLRMAISDPTRTDRLALSSSPDVIVLASEFASESEKLLAEEFEASGGLLLRVAAPSAGDVISQVRVELHGLVKDQIIATAALAATAPDIPVVVAPPKPRLPVADSRHAEDRGLDRGFTHAEVNDALGERWTRPRRARMGDAPAPGAPLLIGIQSGTPGSPDAKDVLLCVTSAGRHLHLVVVRTDEKSTGMSVVTGWDPDAPENRPIWRSDRLRPTPEGEYKLPPTTWLVW